jgi:hypothetical protein
VVEGGGLENRWAKVPWVRILLPPPKSIPVSTFKSTKPLLSLGNRGFLFLYVPIKAIDIRRYLTVLLTASSNTFNRRYRHVPHRHRHPQRKTQRRTVPTILPFSYLCRLFGTGESPLSMELVILHPPYIFIIPWTHPNSLSLMFFIPYSTFIFSNINLLWSGFFAVFPSFHKYANNMPTH